MKNHHERRKYIAIIGVDGSGKTTITDWLKQELRDRGHEPGFAWSRFNNFTSLPFLAITRLTGHNRHEQIQRNRVGFHDFEEIPKVLRYIFVVAQTVDVNIANLIRLRWPCRKDKVVICERGPWDTIVDVAADTGLTDITRSILYRVFCWQLLDSTRMLLIDRAEDLILDARTELEHDKKLGLRMQMYRSMAEANDWEVVDNNGTLEQTKQRIKRWLDENDY